MAKRQNFKKNKITIDFSKNIDYIKYYDTKKRDAV